MSAQIRIDLDLKPLPIPYHAVKRPDGENFGYKCLRTNPEAIEEIPELIGEPAMKAFVADMNAPGKIFETVRMLHWMDSSDGRISQRLCLGFIFRNRSLFSEYSLCFQFAGHLLQQRVRNNIISDDYFVLDIQPAHLLEERVQGWIMDLYLAGFGATEKEARDRMATVLASMHPLVQTEDAGLSFEQQ